MLLYDYRETRLEEHVVFCSVKVEEYEVPSLKDEADTPHIEIRR